MILALVHRGFGSKDKVKTNSQYAKHNFFEFMGTGLVFLNLAVYEKLYDFQ